MNTVLKKAGIIVAAAATCLLAVSPLAFAGDKGHDHEGDTTVSDNNTNSSGDANTGLVNVTDNNVNAPIQGLNCNDVPVALAQVPVENPTAALTGALALFGTADADSDVDVDNSCNSTQGDSGAGDALEQNIQD